MPATALEQMLLELINRARLDPAAEAARFGIDLNEGLAPGTIKRRVEAAAGLVRRAALDRGRRAQPGDGRSRLFRARHARGRDGVPAHRQCRLQRDRARARTSRAARPAAPSPTAMTLILHQDLFVDAGDGRPRPPAEPAAGQLSRRSASARSPAISRASTPRC